jgi:uncharacterized membrane protein HdeD (DUF308 family)
MASNWSESAPQNLGRGGSEDFWLRALGLPPEQLRSARRWLTATGVLSMVVGVVALAVPAAASVATSIFIGWVLVFAGIVMSAQTFSRSSAERSTLAFVNGLLTLLVGLYIVIFPLSGTVTLTFTLALWFFAIGVLEVYAAIRAWGEPMSAIFGFSGALSGLLGALIVAELPSSAGWAIGLLVGINLILFGVRALILASLLRRAAAT